MLIAFMPSYRSALRGLPCAIPFYFPIAPNPAYARSTNTFLDGRNADVMSTCDGWPIQPDRDMGWIIRSPLGRITSSFPPLRLPVSSPLRPVLSLTYLHLFRPASPLHPLIHLPAPGTVTRHHVSKPRLPFFTPRAPAVGMHLMIFVALSGPLLHVLVLPCSLPCPAPSLLRRPFLLRYLYPCGCCATLTACKSITAAASTPPPLPPGVAPLTPPPRPPAHGRCLRCCSSRMYSDQPALFQSAQSRSCMYPLSGLSHMLRGGWGISNIGALSQPSAITTVDQWLQMVAGWEDVCRVDGRLSIRAEGRSARFGLLRRDETSSDCSCGV